MTGVGFVGLGEVVCLDVQGTPVWVHKFDLEVLCETIPGFKQLPLLDRPQVDLYRPVTIRLSQGDACMVTFFVERLRHVRKVSIDLSAIAREGLVFIEGYGHYLAHLQKGHQVWTRTIDCYIEHVDPQMRKDVAY